MATITFPGGTPAGGPLTFNIANGTDIGSYTSSVGGFTQRCIRVRNAALPNFFVDFRPDATSSRIEAVFWNGEVDPANLTVASGHVRDLPSYTVAITNSGSTIYSATIPYHYWATRWRYKSVDRPVIRAASQLFDNFIPNMTLTAARLSGNNMSSGQPWSGLLYSNPAGQVIQPSLSRGGARSFSTVYTPFMPPDMVGPGGSAMPSTILASGASAGATSINVAGSTGFATADHICIALSNGTTFTARILAISGNTWTLEFALPSSANSGATVYNGEWKLGLVTYIETGGERAELGAMTEWAADYLLNGTVNSLNAIRQHAEMASSEWPFFLPDVQTGAPINFKSDIAHYKVIIGPSDYGGYYRAAFTNQANGWDLHEEDSHFQMHAYIAYALTEDAYFLEGAQYLQAYGMGCTGSMLGREGNPSSSYGQIGWGNLLGNPTGGGGVNGAYTMCSYYGEERTVGNGIRNLAMTFKMAQSTPPAWMLPQSYYSSVAADYAACINILWMTRPGTRWSLFRQLGGDSDHYWQAFEMAYACMGMALADLVRMPGSPSWLTILTFYFGFFDAITNGTSGWDNQTPQPHDIMDNGGGYPAGVTDFNNYTTWGQLSAAVASYVKTYASAPSAATPSNQQGGSMGNCNMIYAACAMAKSRGVAAATNAKAWMDNFIDYNYPNNSDASMGISFEMKCGFDGN